MAVQQGVWRSIREMYGGKNHSLDMLVEKSSGWEEEVQELLLDRLVHGRHQ